MIEGLSRTRAYRGNKTKYNKIDNNAKRKISYHSYLVLDLLDE